MVGRLRFASLALAPLLLVGCYAAHAHGPEGDPPDEPPPRRDGPRRGGGVVDSGIDDPVERMDAGVESDPDPHRRWDAAWPHPDSSFWSDGRDAGPGAPPDAPPCRDLGPRPGPDDRVDLLSWQRAAILGAWEGTRGSPWDGTRPIRMRFDDDGTYWAECTEAAVRDCAPMYWGDLVVDGPSARYELDDVTASGGGEGRIFPVWMGSSSWPGTIDSLVIDASGTTLDFRMWDPEGRGPLTFSLTRACE